MDTLELIKSRSSNVIAEADSALSRAHLNGYENAGPETTRVRLQGLLTQILQCVESRRAVPLIRYVETIAKERFHHGVELFEVQTAFNALEEAIWKEMRATMTPSNFVEAVGLLSTIIGTGKDALARSYVALASSRHAPALDIDRLSAGHETSLQFD